MKEFQVTKLDAAKRQLETAVRLYFSESDPVSIHTLTAAAYNVLRDLTKQKGLEPMLIKGEMLDYVRPQYRKMIRAKINEAETFFKHANRDHDATLRFNPGMTELLIADASAQYKKLAGERTPLFAVYRLWFTANNPKFYILTDEFQQAINATGPSIVQMGRAQYFSMVLPFAIAQSQLPPAFGKSKNHPAKPG